MLGLVAGATGIILSWIAAWALMRFVFEVPHTFQPMSSFVVLLCLVALTWFTGWITSRGIASHPPLAILRKE